MPFQYLISPIIVLALLLTSCREPSTRSVSVNSTSPVDAPTFNEHIAPIIYNNCSNCHRPGEPAPFTFLSYADVKKRASQIAEVTTSGYMPPWLPEPGFGNFLGERHITSEQVAIINRWVETGAPEGDPSKKIDPPEFTPGWQLGKPDLVVELPKPFPLPAEGKDIYRNFVIPTPITSARYIRAIEFRPGDTKAIHHAFVLVDPTRTTRDLESADPLPGFEGMNPGSETHSPGGHFISWQPGKTPHPEREGISWRLAPTMDLVVQIHLRPTGKLESIQPKIGLFFTDKPPRLNPLKMVLASNEINLPPGSTDQSIKTSFKIPVAADVLALVPHAHYLGKKLHAYATLPDGTRNWIIRIDDWDFNWQGDYQFKQPLHLPAGSIITQHFTYDNSADNPHNPFSPPRQVNYGPQSTDEMGELWIQLLASDPGETKILHQAYTRWNLVRRRTELQEKLDDGKITASELTALGKILITFNEDNRARQILQRAADEAPDASEPRYLMGMIAAKAGAFSAANAFFIDAVSVDPKHFAAHNGLGNVALKARDFRAAEKHYMNAVAIDPENPVALSNLGLTILYQNRPTEAIPHFEKSLSIRRDHEGTLHNLQRAKKLLANPQ